MSKFRTLYHENLRERIKNWDQANTEWLKRQKAVEEDWQKQQKKIEWENYLLLRKEIEAMPLYLHWRNKVLKEYGRKCMMCSSTKKIEVDHRDSFHSIIKNNRISNTEQAYKCKELWDVANGAPLCKACHDQTSSNVYYNSQIN